MNFRSFPASLRGDGEFAPDKGHSPGRQEALRDSTLSGRLVRSQAVAGYAPDPAKGKLDGEDARTSALFRLESNASNSSWRLD
jgi:hypothetical protein